MKVSLSLPLSLSLSRSSHFDVDNHEGANKVRSILNKMPQKINTNLKIGKMNIRHTLTVVNWWQSRDDNQIDKLIRSFFFLFWFGGMNTLFILTIWTHCHCHHWRIMTCLHTVFSYQANLLQFFSNCCALNSNPLARLMHYVFPYGQRIISSALCDYYYYYNFVFKIDIFNWPCIHYCYCCRKNERFWWENNRRFQFRTRSRIEDSSIFWKIDDSGIFFFVFCFDYLPKRVKIIRILNTNLLSDINLVCTTKRETKIHSKTVEGEKMFDISISCKLFIIR